MLFSRVGLYRAKGSDNMFIVEVGQNAMEADRPLHVSQPLAADEVTNLLRHMNLSDTEILRRLQQAVASSSWSAAAAAR